MSLSYNVMWGLSEAGKNSVHVRNRGHLSPEAEKRGREGEGTNRTARQREPDALISPRRITQKQDVGPRVLLEG